MGAAPVPALSTDARIAQILAAVPEIESVYIVKIGKMLAVYSLIESDHDERVIDAISDREFLIMGKFRNVRFDFNVIARHGRPVDEVMGRRSPVWQRQGDPCQAATSI